MSFANVVLLNKALDTATSTPEKLNTFVARLSRIAEHKARITGAYRMLPDETANKLL